MAKKADFAAFHTINSTAAKDWIEKWTVAWGYEQFEIMCLTSSSKRKCLLLKIENEHAKFDLCLAK